MKSFNQLPLETRRAVVARFGDLQWTLSEDYAANDPGEEYRHRKAEAIARLADYIAGDQL